MKRCAMPRDYCAWFIIGYASACATRYEDVAEDGKIC